jgi:TRAP-type mannitol/chloroaromatic compound transport system permease small subunit
MPSLNFVLPHWLYWGGLAVFPLLAWYLVERQKRNGVPRGPSLFVAYLFWLCSGFLGIHRFYLKSAWGLAFIPVFLVIIHSNGVIRDLREDVSRTRAALESAHTTVERAKAPPNVTVTPEMTAALKAAEDQAAKSKAEFEAAEADLDKWHSISRWLVILMAAMLLCDAALLPGAVRRVRAAELLAPPAHAPAPEIPEIHEAGTGEDPTIGVHTRITDAIEWINTKAGEYVAYWAVISVFAYYYEVLGRYVFNSPTNWVHESMFLMYGMQYMLAGAFAYREDQHVRVDVFYAKFPPRGKAIADIVTSVFFFIFIGTMFVTGTRFALDAIQVGEHSFTEWGVQYWPVKLMIPIGSGLLLLQGVAKLIKDIVLVARGGV